MKSTTFALGALMASVAIAQPHRQHMAKHHKRNQEVVWVTDYDYVTETASITTTIWVSEGFVAPTETPATSTSESSAAAPSQSSPNQFFENANKEPKAAPTSTSTTPVYVAPTPESPPAAPPAPSPTYVAPTPSPEPTTSAYVAPAPVETPAYVAPAVVEAPKPVEVAPAPAATTSAAPVVAASPYSAPASSPASSSNSGGPCSSGSPCTGDITFYEAGLGACGETTNGETDKVIALPVGMMGAQSNGNPYCGKSVTIKKGSKTTTAIVVDKCMGCLDHSIDLSNAAFAELADFGVGRTTAEWWFN